VSSTADPKSAQAHARAQGGIRVEAMPILPPSTADGLPAGVEPGAMLWAETIAAGGYAAKRLARGARIELTDLSGDACVSMLAFNAEQPVERLNVADTLKVQWNAYLGAGKLVLTDMGRVIFSILEDEAGTHDAFCGASNAASNARRYGEGDNWGPNPNARDRFMLALAKFGLARKDIHPCINWFKGTRIAEDGTVNFEGGPFAAGRSLTLRAEMDVIVAFANCPHVLDARPAYMVTPVRVAAWRGAVTSETDPIRNATPEGLRAFLNVEDYYRR
jgi:urea carboxylase-associated protein 2